MAYLVPFYLALPSIEKVTSLGFILKDEPDIPDDTYKFQEWYCPNPDCDCFEGLLRIFAAQQNSVAARVFVPLDPAQSPYLDPAYPITPTALAMLYLIAQYVKKDSAYLKRLRDHYWLVRAVAMDPKHPAHPALIEWATNGAAVPASKPGRKKR
jgi:hypothetical protein